MVWWRDAKIWGRGQCIYAMCEMVAEYEAMEPGGQARSLIIPPRSALESTAEPTVIVLASMDQEAVQVLLGGGAGITATRLASLWRQDLCQSPTGASERAKWR